MPTLFGVSPEMYLTFLLIAGVLFFMWRWIFKRFVKSQRTRTIATWLATIVSAPIIYIAVVLIWLSSMSYYPSRDFDKEKWFADKEKRYELSEDLIDSRILLGKTKQQIRQLLGDEGNKDESNYWTYYLGFKPGLSIDPDVLDIYFEDGRVVRVAQHQS